MTMQLTSNAFAPGGRIPVRYTCDGQNVSPPLAWSDVPAGTRGLALICSDPDAPAGVWYHWAVYDIPTDTRGLPEGVPPASNRPPQGTNDFGHLGYGGPCPPPRDRPHRYVFTLYALSVDRLAVPPQAGCRAIEAAARARPLTMVQLMGVYGR